MPPIFYNGIECNDVYFNGVKTTGFLNGNQIWGSESKPIYTLTLQTDGHGTLNANTLTGYAGDKVNLTTAYNTYYRFSGYGVTGGSVAGNVFTFGSTDATVKANFKSNTFTASGTFDLGTVPALGRNRLVFSAYPKLQAASNSAGSITSAVKQSQYTILSAYSTSYTAGWTGSNITAFNGFASNVINTHFYWDYKNKIISDYSMSAVSGSRSKFQMCQTNSGTVIKNGTIAASGKGSGTTYSATYENSGTTTTLSSFPFMFGFASGGRRSDNITLSNGTLINVWSASGIAP